MCEKDNSAINLNPFVSELASIQLGAEIADAVGLFQKAFAKEADVVEAIAACKKQHAFVTTLVETPKTLVTHRAPAEKVLADPRLFPDRSVDLIVTSPPYFDLERYGETAAEAKGQIHTRASTVDDYLSLFLHPVLKNCARVLAPGGVLALNIDDHMPSKTLLCKPALTFLKSLPQLHFVGTAGLRKGRGFGQGSVGVSDADKRANNTKAEPVYLFQKKGGRTRHPTRMASPCRRCGTLRDCGMSLRR